MNEDPVQQFESHLEELIQSIEKYAPDPSISFSLISDADRIGSQLEEITRLKDSVSQFDQTLKNNDRNLSNSLKEIISTLVECKRELDLLPKPNLTEQPKSANAIDPDPSEADAVLSYALKLSKFSKIPRTFDGFLLPNNFIWPGDDNMRRGTLAMASLIPGKIANYENYGPDYVPPPEHDVATQVNGKTTTSNKDVDQNPETNAENKEDDEEMDDEDFEEFIPERRASVDHSAQSNSASVMTGLDLLDSDDE